MSSGIWNGIKFVINDYVEECDWWIVCHANGLLETENVVCDPEHLVFVSMEPPAWGRPEDFYKQFSLIVACDRKIKHPNVIYKNGLTWWVGLKVIFKDGNHFSTKFKHNYDSLMKLAVPEKQNKISVITSNNRFFPGHKNRLEFIEKLKKHEISNFIDFYGGYHNPIEDKFDALIGYKYHLALENR